MKKIFRPTAAFAALVVALAAAAVPAKAQSLKAPEIIKRHLDSIGPAQLRASLKNHLVVGRSSFGSKFPERKTTGKALIVSQGTDLMFTTSFMSQEYPYEKIGYFNEKISLPFVTAGARSPLGAFIADHETMMSNGLFTGVISTAWPFAEGRKLKGRMEAGGIKKIDGRRAYVIDYFPSSAASSEYTIKLYFDAETFQHIRTEYRHVIAPQQDPFGVLGRQTGVKLGVTENFSDFKAVDGLTFPHAYKINYITDSNSGTYEYEWGVTITDYYFNQKLEPTFFSFDSQTAEKP
jgi:hypothetical protein